MGKRVKVKEKKYRFEKVINENKEKKRKKLKKLKESIFTKSLRKESLEKRV